MNPFSRRIHPAAVLAVALGLLCITGIVNAQSATRVTDCSPTTPNNAICITGTAPTTNTDGTPVVQPLTYRFQQRAGTTGTFTTVATGLTELKYYAQNLAPGEYFFRAFANCATCTAESAASNVASRSATQPPVVPNAPVLIIAATIRANAPPTYRIVYTVRPREGELVFVAPEAMRSAFR
jgi:hypothetical protein